MAAVYICNHVIDITQNSPSCRAWVLTINFVYNIIYHFLNNELYFNCVLIKYIFFKQIISNAF